MDPARRALGGTIWVDPCSNPQSIVGAVHSICLPEDGLALAWDAFGDTAYVNCPYGRKVIAWMKACAAHARYMTIVGLVAARPDTKWWHDVVVPTATAWCNLRGRLTFLGAKHPAPFPSVFPFWSPTHDAEPFVEEFRELGTVAARLRGGRLVIV